MKDELLSLKNQNENLKQFYTTGLNWFNSIMATACTDNKGSDHVMEYCCSSCEEEAIAQEAAYYCMLCSKFFSCQCVEFHGKLFKKHETYGQDESDQWPVSKVTQDVLEKCRAHIDEHLKFYCEDHRFMCCNSCVVLNHR